ncbi:hypothetical protein HBN50_03420 [Halobacteriovorax sp. GB3]|uniref:hypothetical protein n=1 Tax=Halobacteriovorax sp. GB3 TaxID=2719615 RepID=UPI00235FC35E|nr:hypothetical protein [Halobacteriovorax sp. GB3]MDD0852127.1 hypothetical protein [Halobacteriovorax sp. GB3]
MKKIILCFTFLSSFSSLALTVNSGMYVSREGCRVEVFETNDGEHFVEYTSPEDNEVYTSSYTVFTSDFLAVNNGPGLCGDEDGLPVAQVEINGNELEASCGGKLSILDVSLKLTVNANNDLSTLKYKSKVALLSGIGWGLPQPKKTKGDMECTGFVKE